MVIKQLISAENRSKFESLTRITNAGDNTIQLKYSQEDKKQLIINQSEKFWLLWNSIKSYFFYESTGQWLVCTWSFLMPIICISKIMLQYTKLEHIQQVKKWLQICTNIYLNWFIMKEQTWIHWEMNINIVTHLLAKLNLN